jgi:xanthine dehydrogenase large subunit
MKNTLLANLEDPSPSRDAGDDPQARLANAGGAHPVAASASQPAAAPPAQACGQPLPHESAAAQVQGLAPYVDDIPVARGTLFAAPILSQVAHGRLLEVDASAALAMPGVRGVVLASDIPGDPLLASFAHDEPVFAQATVEHVGQVIGLVVADTVMQARRAARHVRCRIEPMTPVLTVHAALLAKSHVLPPVFLKRGNAAEALAQAAHTLHGEMAVGGQEHFYLEGQIAYALPQEQGQMLVHSSTQHPGEVQHWVAHALGIASHAVRVECRRMGGAFGGKETQAGQVAVWAALAARKLRCPVKLRLDRDDDFLITGKRHPFCYEYTVGFDDRGRIGGLKLLMLANCGFSADLSGAVADRAIFQVDNAYFLRHVDIASYRLKTNTQSHTAFRGFGGPQGLMVIETILGDIARTLGLDAFDVRMANLYSDEAVEPSRMPPGPGEATHRNVTHYGMVVEDNILAPLLGALERSCGYRRRRAAIDRWNAADPVLRRGMALTPVKFGVSFTATHMNQAGALVHVYLDGSVQVNHGGTEMGQGLHTKVLQVVADELGVPLRQVVATASDTSKVPNASPTAASAGTDLNARAAQFAARTVRGNIAQLLAGLDGCEPARVHFENGCVATPRATRTFAQAATLAHQHRVQLWSDGFYRTPKIHYDKATMTGRPFYYFAYGAACTEVAIDTLTGESRVLKVDILQDVGQSINPAIDIGQIEGGFVQGMGWLTTEHLVWDERGRLATHAPSTYKIPAAGDVPAHFKVAFWPAPNLEDNIFGSKAVGEPPLMLAVSVWEALRDAVASALPPGALVDMQTPAIPEHVLAALGRMPPAHAAPALSAPRT